MSDIDIDALLQEVNASCAEALEMVVPSLAQIIRDLVDNDHDPVTIITLAVIYRPELSERPKLTNAIKCAVHHYQRLRAEALEEIDHGQTSAGSS